jgi:hypothetical protein
VKDYTERDLVATVETIAALSECVDALARRFPEGSRVRDELSAAAGSLDFAAVEVSGMSGRGRVTPR